MSYFQVDEVGRLINNLARWDGDGASIRGCGGLWARIIRESFMSSYPVVTLGLDAGRTKLAMQRLALLGDGLARSLWTFHRSSLTFEHQARQVLGVSRSTYHRRLERAHPAFVEIYSDVCREAADGARARELFELELRQAGAVEPLPLKFARVSDDDYKKP